MGGRSAVFAVARTGCGFRPRVGASGLRQTRSGTESEVPRTSSAPSGPWGLKPFGPCGSGRGGSMFRPVISLRGKSRQRATTRRIHGAWCRRPPGYTPVRMPRGMRIRRAWNMRSRRGRGDGGPSRISRKTSATSRLAQAPQYGQSSMGALLVVESMLIETETYNPSVDPTTGVRRSVSGKVEETRENATFRTVDDPIRTTPEEIRGVDLCVLPGQ